jgi:MYXO-CTERM domain-containing protein
MSLDLNRVAPTAPLHLPLARTRTPGRVPTKPKTTVSDRANVGLPRKLRTAIASGLMGVAAIGGVGAATSSADAGIVRDPYNVWDPYARAQGQNYLAGGSALQGGGAAHLRIESSIGTRNTSSIFLGNYYDPQQGGMRSLFVTAMHNIADFDGHTTTSAVRLGSNFNTDPGQVIGVNRWIAGNMSGSRNPSMRDYSFFWGSTTVTGSNVNNVVFGEAFENLAFVGYGRTGSEAQGNLGIDGNARAVFSPLDFEVSFGFNSEIYKQGIALSGNQLAGLGRITSGYSGGLVVNSLGQTVGMVVAGSLGTQFNGVSVFQSFWNDPVFMGQFNELSTAVPSPGALSLLGLAGAAGARRRR